MKYLSALLCLFLCYQLSTQIPHPPLSRPGPHKDEAECMDRAGITQEELDEIKDSNEIHTQLENGEGDFRKLGCFLACMLQQYGLMEGASLNVTMKDHPKHHHHSGESNERWMHFVQVQDECKAAAEGTGDECDVALAFEVCMHRNLQDDD